MTDCGKAEAVSERECGGSSVNDAHLDVKVGGRRGELLFLKAGGCVAEAGASVEYYKMYKKRSRGFFGGRLQTDVKRSCGLERAAARQ